MIARLRGIGDDRGGQRAHAEDQRRGSAISVSAPRRWRAASHRRLPRHGDCAGRRALVAYSAATVDLLAGASGATASVALTAHSRARIPVRRLVTTVTSGPLGWSGLEVDVTSDQLFLTDRQRSVRLDHLKLERCGLHRCSQRATSPSGAVRGLGTCLTDDHRSHRTGRCCAGPISAKPTSASISRSCARPGARVRPSGSRWPYGRKTPSVNSTLPDTEARKQQLSLRRRSRCARAARRPHDHRPSSSTTAGSLRALTRCGAVHPPRQIDLLLERRQALITAAVTGQLDIAGVAA